MHRLLLSSLLMTKVFCSNFDDPVIKEKLENLKISMNVAKHQNAISHDYYNGGDWKVFSKDLKKNYEKTLSSYCYEFVQKLVSTKTDLRKVLDTITGKSEFSTLVHYINYELMAQERIKIEIENAYKNGFIKGQNEFKQTCVNFLNAPRKNSTSSRNSTEGSEREEGDNYELSPPQSLEKKRSKTPERKESGSQPNLTVHYNEVE